MREIRILDTAELERFVDLSVDAYPGMRVSSPDERSRMRERLSAGVLDGRFVPYGVFQDGCPVGVMRYHDFDMRLLSVRTLVGGLGGVAVALEHKKEKIAFDMVQHFVAHFRDRGACLAALYPFRPDFYRRMGFGYGTKVSFYELLPANLPHGSTKAHVERLGVKDATAVAACYDRYLERTNGLMARPAALWDQLLAEPATRVVGVRSGDGIGAYLVFRFVLGPEDNFLKHDLLVVELAFDTPDDLGELLTFLHDQADQIGRVLVNAQDPEFHLLLDDPRSGTVTLLPHALAHACDGEGVGIMYRVLDTRRLFEVLGAHDFNGQTVVVAFDVDDDFCPANSGRTVVAFEAGHARLAPESAPEVTVALRVADLSSLVIGAARFRTLAHYGLAHYGLARVSEARHVATLDRLFSAPPPQCWTGF